MAHFNKSSRPQWVNKGLFPAGYKSLTWNIVDFYTPVTLGYILVYHLIKINVSEYTTNHINTFVSITLRLVRGMSCRTPFWFIVHSFYEYNKQFWQTSLKTLGDWLYDIVIYGDIVHWYRRFNLREIWLIRVWSGEPQYNRRHEADILKGHWHENELLRVGYEPTTSPLDVECSNHWAISTGTFSSPQKCYLTTGLSRFEDTRFDIVHWSTAFRG